jgi:hypothetical protein
VRWPTQPGLTVPHGKIETGERNVTLLNILEIEAALNGSASDLLSEAAL